MTTKLKIIKNEEYCLVYCHNCGSTEKKLLEISNDIQNYIAFCFPCIQKAFNNHDKIKKCSNNYTIL